MWWQAYGSPTETACEVLHYHSERWKGIWLVPAMTCAYPWVSEDSMRKSALQEKKKENMQVVTSIMRAGNIAPLILIPAGWWIIQTIVFFGQLYFHALPSLETGSCTASILKACDRLKRGEGSWGKGYTRTGEHCKLTFLWFAKGLCERATLYA